MDIHSHKDENLDLDLDIETDISSLEDLIRTQQKRDAIAIFTSDMDRLKKEASKSKLDNTLGIKIMAYEILINNIQHSYPATSLSQVMSFTLTSPIQYTTVENPVKETIVKKSFTGDTVAKEIIIKEIRSKEKLVEETIMEALFKKRGNNKSTCEDTITNVLDSILCKEPSSLFQIKQDHGKKLNF
jgi:hypothetical protein